MHRPIMAVPRTVATRQTEWLEPGTSVSNEPRVKVAGVEVGR